MQRDEWKMVLGERKEARGVSIEYTRAYQYREGTPKMNSI